MFLPTPSVHHTLERITSHEGSNHGYDLGLLDYSFHFVRRNHKEHDGNMEVFVLRDRERARERESVCGGKTKQAANRFGDDQEEKTA